MLLVKADAKYQKLLLVDFVPKVPWKGSRRTTIGENDICANDLQAC